MRRAARAPLLRLARLAGSYEGIPPSTAADGASTRLHSRLDGRRATVGIALEGVSKRYGKAAAVNDVSIAIGEGEFFSLLGPSGCGKTTTLRMIAGFEVPDEGRILLQGRT